METMPARDGPEFTSLYAAYHARVLAYVSRLIGREEADDVTQEVFVKVSRSLGSLKDPSKVATWIYTIALNTIRDAARSRAFRIDRIPAGSGDPEAGGAVEARSSHPGAAGGRTPEEIAIRNEMVACYLDFVNQLPPDSREVYMLSEFEGLSSRDIARRLSLSVGAAKIRLHRARTKLNDELRRNCQCYHNERGELMAEPKRR
jgi:RNA polymerase sigma-70 factor (ECF subfamily)